METPSDKSQAMFASIVAMFSSQAMMAMGKLHNPVSGKVDRDLAAAQYMIDLLAMLEERTQGNLMPQESNFLATTLRDLRLNYVVEVNKEKNPASPEADNMEPRPEAEQGIPDNVA